MRVAIVSDFAEVNGGAAMVAITSARELAERGVQVLFVHATGPVSPRLDHPAIDVKGLGLEEVWARGNRIGAAVAAIWNIEAARRLQQLLRVTTPTPCLLHVHQWSKAMSPSTLDLGRRSGLPCLVSMHDYFLVCPNGNYFLFSHDQPCQYRPMSTRCVLARCDSRSHAHKSVRLVRQLALRRATAARDASGRFAVIHVSDFARSVAAPFLPKDWLQFVVPNPVDAERRPAVDVSANRAFVFIGRFTREKRPALFAEAAKRAGVPATFLGQGPEEAAIRAADPDARILPWGDATAVQRVLEGARALVFPSAWYETSGLVVAEALARGVPAVVSTATGARDLVRHGVDGWQVAPDDLPALVERLQSLEADDVVQRMGQQAYASYWSEPPDASAHTDRLMAVYQAVLGAEVRAS